MSTAQSVKNAPTEGHDMAAPEGNTNSCRNNRLWGDTIRRALVQGDAERLRKIAETLLIKAEEGDLGAIKELGDRLDGKASQAVDLGSDPDRPVIQKLIREIVRPDNKDR
jgi:hypothetical protein